MNQLRQKAQKVDQFLYQGRWVDKAHFRVFVYDRAGNSKLANSYQEFEDLTINGVWFASKPELSISPSKKERKNVTLSDS